MKLLFGCLTICVALSYASCEVCTVDADCATTMCTGGSIVVCQHPDGDGVTTNGGLCTCQQSGTGGCTTQSDCFGDGAPNLNCPDSQRHCYDNNCICDRFPGSGK